MADESADIDLIPGGGGYIDDDIDLDDDDDEPLTGTLRSLGGNAAHQQPAKKQRAAPVVSVSAAAMASEIADEQPKSTDFLLRPGSSADREVILARFMADLPDLQAAERVRIYREREGTEKGFEAAMKAKRKQDVYYNSYVGVQRLKRYAMRGITTIPDRTRKDWVLEVAKEGTTPTEPPPPPMRGEVPMYPPEADVYRGMFDGQTGSSYALMMMNADGKHVEVVPVGQNSWYSFRNARPGGVENPDDATAHWKKAQKKGDQRIGKFQDKYEDAQERREGLQGGISRFEEKHGVVKLGIRRKFNAKYEESKNDGQEFMDFEQEFDNDDVLQVDKEEIENTAGKRKNRNYKKEKDDFQRMIKDEPKPEEEKSPQSDSEEDEEKPPSRSRSPSPPKSNGGSRSISPVRQVPPLRPPLSRPSPARPPSAQLSQPSSRAATPQLPDVQELAPAPGTLPNESHILAVLRKLIQHKGSQPVTVKEFLPYFERNTPAQKSNLMRIIKSVCIMRSDPSGAKGYILFPKKS